MQKLRTAREWIGTAAFPWPSLRQLEVGDLLTACYSLTGLEVGTTRSDKPFLTLRLSDVHGTIEAKVWEDAETVRERLEIGFFVGVRGRVESFRDARQLKIEAIERIDLEPDELELFMPRSRRDFTEMEAELDGWMASLHDAALRALVERLLGGETASGRAFRRAPAAKHNHHAWVGGLLEHTLSLVGICQRLDEHYAPRLDRDLLLAGAMLHDVGKIREISLEPGFHYTTEGRLLGHILIGLDLVRDAAREVPELDPERLRLLLHLVASHQGRYEWQSPRQPLTLEAILLHYADDMDAKVQQASDLIERVESGWTPYDRGLGRELFRHGEARGDAGADTPPPAQGSRTPVGRANGGSRRGSPSDPRGGGSPDSGPGIPPDPFTIDMFEGD